MGKILDYVRMHTGEMVVYGIMAAVTVGIGVAAGMHPLDALAHRRH